MDLLHLAWALPLLPLTVFAFVLLTGRRTPELLPAGLGIASMAAVFAASLGLLASAAAGKTAHAAVTWFASAGLHFEFGVKVDALAATMVAVVSFVSMLVQIYSIGYMHGDPRIRWYYGAISLFTAAMLGVVLADGWLLMYMCWEVMGLASYLLIGFWYDKLEPPAASAKAFLVTRFGDVGFGLALALMFLNTGSMTFAGVFSAVEHHAWSGPTLTACALLLLAGAMGKSAQFPLHGWLPDAMAGPTPGSALIHAATMVAAGVYLVARSFPLFEAAPATLVVVGTVGTITAVMAALIALAQNDIKKVLAYSTISQLGYMFLALGTGNWIAAIFHLVTHAFFKALLFLGAGSVIHATNTQDVREMGGLWRKMPWTTVTWVIGALSLAGIPPLAGFWSKDEILLSALHAGQWPVLIAGVFTAALTAFYMGRTTFLAFFAKPGPVSASSHAHESPWVMTAPLVVLAGLAATVGFVGSPLTGYTFGKFLGESEAAGPNWILAGVAVGVAAAAIWYAWSRYVTRRAPRFAFENGMRAFLYRRFWIDEVYDGLVKATEWIAERMRHADTALVDGLIRGVGWIGLGVSKVLAIFDVRGVDAAVEGLGQAVTDAGEVRRIQTGNPQLYLILLVAAIVVLAVVFSR